MSRRPWVAGLPAIALLGGLLLAGCAGRPRPTGPVAAPGLEPWELPPDAAPSQRLYRLSYDGPRGAGSLRLTLRLAGPERFRIGAADALGRALWSLEVTPGRPALLLDHREGLFCRPRGTVALPELALEAVALNALPGLLLGRLPARPAGAAERLAEDEIAIEDAAGRRWTVRLGDAGAVTGWTLWEEGEPVLWWTPDDGGGILSHRRGSQFRWRQTVAETTDGGLEPLTVPPGFAEGECG